MVNHRSAGTGPAVAAGAQRWRAVVVNHRSAGTGPAVAEKRAAVRRSGQSSLRRHGAGGGGRGARVAVVVNQRSAGTGPAVADKGAICPRMHFTHVLRCVTEK